MRKSTEVLWSVGVMGASEWMHFGADETEIRIQSGENEVEEHMPGRQGHRQRQNSYNRVKHLLRADHSRVRPTGSTQGEPFAVQSSQKFPEPLATRNQPQEESFQQSN